MKKNGTENIYQRGEEVKGQFLLLLLDGLEDQLSLTKIADKLGKSKQALNYHINVLKRKGLIEQTSKTPFSKFIITPLGQLSKKKLRYPQKGPVFHCHALQMGFDIGDFGTFEFVTNAKRKVVRINNWDYTTEVHGKYHVKIQETGLMVISCPDAYTREPDDAFFEMREEAKKISNRFTAQFGMKFTRTWVVKRGHKSIVGSAAIAKLLGRGKITKTEWVDASEGEEELESYENSYAFEKLFAMPEEVQNIKGSVNKLETVISEKLTPAIEKHSEDIRLHLTAIQEIRDAIREFRDVVKEMKQNGNVK